MMTKMMAVLVLERVGWVAAITTTRRQNDVADDNTHWG